MITAEEYHRTSEVDKFEYSEGVKVFCLCLVTKDIVYENELF